MVAVDKNISGAHGTFRDFKKESVVTRPDLIRWSCLVDMADAHNQVIDKNAVYLTNIIPDAV